MLLDGLFVPLTTPFYPSGELNTRKLEHNVRRYSLTPAAGLLALGELGEEEMLSEGECAEVLRVTAAECSPSKVLIAAVGRSSVRSTLRLVDQAAEAQFDVVLVQGGLDLLATRHRLRWEAELLTYFRAIADTSSLPILVSGRLGHALPEGLVAQLSTHPQIIGAFEIEADPERTATLLSATSTVRRNVVVTQTFTAMTGRMLKQRSAEAAQTYIAAADLGSGGSALATAPPRAGLKTRTKTIGFQVVAGRSLEMLRSLRGGATAVVPALGACAPQSCYEVVAAWKDGNSELAEEKQMRLLRPAQRIDEVLGIAGVKFGCDVNGYFGGQPRLPRLPLTGHERLEIEAILKPLRG